VYNVISDLINKISSTPPFQKVNIGLLTESLPIRKDIIQSASFDPEKIANHEYLDELASRLNGEFLKLAQFKVNSQEEANARATKQREIEAAFRMLTSAGYETTEATVQKILKRLEGIEQDIKGHEFTTEELEEEKEAIHKLPLAKEKLKKYKSKMEEEVKELEEFASKKGSRYNSFQKIEAAESKIDSVMKKLKEEYQHEGTTEERKKVLRIQHSNYEKRLQKLDEEKEKLTSSFTTENIENAIRMSDVLEEVENTNEKYKTKRKKAAVEVPKLKATKAANVEKVTKLREHKTKKGRGRPHKEADDKFGDNPELEPYLTKYLRPSKYHNKTDDFSSSDESSGSDSEGPKKIRGSGKRKTKKVIEDYEIIESQPKAEKGILIEKKTRAKKGMGGKKPVHQARPESDLWFM
jgi:chromosome segregation ATPase